MHLCIHTYICAICMNIRMFTRVDTHTISNHTFFFNDLLHIVHRSLFPFTSSRYMQFPTIHQAIKEACAKGNCVLASEKKTWWNTTR